MKVGSSRPAVRAGDNRDAFPPPRRDRNRPWRDLADHIGRTLRSEMPFNPCTLSHRDPDFIRALLPRFERLALSYLRLEVAGLDHVTSRPVLYVANHNGGIMGPDLFCTLSVLWRQLGPDYPLYAMAHDLAMRRVVPLGRLLQGLGAMRASPANAHRVLADGGSVLVYPGGDLDAYRPFWMRDQIVFGERAGFARAAIAADVPIVPIVAHGAHRSALILHEGARIARLLRLDRWSRIQRFPVALGLPWGLALGPWVPYLPLPFKVRMRILPPIVTRGREYEVVRGEVISRMQAALTEMAGAARSGDPRG